MQRLVFLLGCVAMLGIHAVASAHAQSTQYYWAEKTDGSKIECHPGPTGTNNASWGVLSGGGLDVAWAVKATSASSSNVAIDMRSGNRRLVALIAGYGTDQPQILDRDRQPLANPGVLQVVNAAFGLCIDIEKAVSNRPAIRQPMPGSDGIASFGLQDRWDVPPPFRLYALAGITKPRPATGPVLEIADGHHNPIFQVASVQCDPDDTGMGLAMASVGGKYTDITGQLWSFQLIMGQMFGAFPSDDQGNSEGGDKIEIDTNLATGGAIVHYGNDLLHGTDRQDVMSLFKQVITTCVKQDQSTYQDQSQ